MKVARAWTISTGGACQQAASCEPQPARTIARHGSRPAISRCSRGSMPADTMAMDRLAPFAFVLLWSSSFVSTRAGLNDVSPLAFVTLRLALCALVLLAVMAVSQRRFAPLAGKWQHCAIAGALIH